MPSPCTSAWPRPRGATRSRARTPRPASAPWWGRPGGWRLEGGAPAGRASRHLAFRDHHVVLPGRSPQGEAEPPHEGKHRRVVRQDLPDDLPDAAVPGPLEEPLHEEAAEAVALHLVAHDDGELRFLPAG